jgi:hypothetical protein
VQAGGKANHPSWGFPLPLLGCVPGVEGENGRATAAPRRWGKASRRGGVTSPSHRTRRGRSREPGAAGTRTTTSSQGRSATT